MTSSLTDQPTDQAPTSTAAIDQALAAHQPAAAFQALIDDLRSRKQYHQLFDALLVQKKWQLGCPLTKPTGFDDVPVALRDDFENTYIDAAREIGQLLLADGQLRQAWVYLHAIRETEPVKAALEQLPLPTIADAASEELLNLALYEKVAPARGVEIMLKTHGVCSTITALDQVQPQMSTIDRAQCAAMMVRRVHKDLSDNVQRDLQQRMPFLPPAKSLREMVTGRDWLFANHNYHLDVSHLHSTVRFGRSLPADSPELPLARDLAEYGAQLDPQFQYPGEPPFQDFYPAHIMYFRALLNDERDAALAYFRDQLAREPDAPDRALIAYALVDLHMRLDQTSAAVDLAREHILPADPEFFPAFAELCQSAGRWDALSAAAESRNDPVMQLAARLGALKA